MDCREFHETYTDLLDGLLAEADEIRCCEHLAACPPCHRFDRSYHLGVAVLRAVPCARSSRAFAARVLNSVRTDSGGRVPSFAFGLAGAALVVTLLGFLAIDLRVLEHRALAASARSRDTTLAASPPDSSVDLITVRLRDAALGPPFWDPNATVLVRNAALPSAASIEVPAAWAGR